MIGYDNIEFVENALLTYGHVSANKPNLILLVQRDD